MSDYINSEVMATFPCHNELNWIENIGMECMIKYSSKTMCELQRNLLIHVSDNWLYIYKINNSLSTLVET